MTDEQQRTLGQLEARVTHLEALMEEIASDVKATRHILDEARGGGKVILWMVGLLGGLVGAVAVKVFNVLGHV